MVLIQVLQPTTLPGGSPSQDATARCRAEEEHRRFGGRGVRPERTRRTRGQPGADHAGQSLEHDSASLRITAALVRPELDARRLRAGRLRRTLAAAFGENVLSGEPGLRQHQPGTRPLGNRTTTACTYRSRSNRQRGDTIGFSYTLSKSKNNVGEFFSSPIDPFNVSKDWGRSDDDQRHRLVIRGALQSPNEAPAPPLEYPSSPAPTFGQITAVGEPRSVRFGRARPIPEEAHITGPGAPLQFRFPLVGVFRMNGSVAERRAS